MTLGALRVSALALSAAAFVLSAPLSGAGAATVAHHYQHVIHPRDTHGVHGYVARNHVAHHHYAWRNGRRYAYGYNPGAAVAAGLGVLVRITGQMRVVRSILRHPRPPVLLALLNETGPIVAFSAPES